MTNSSAEQEDRGNAEKTGAGAARTERKIPVVGDRIESRDLFAGVREIIIGHGSELYRLRLTAQNKLILTK
jgi:hemin uptake protein HemP